jgi:hypothetical protein
LAPPHWVFSTVVPPDWHDAVCLQVEPSDMEKMKSRSVSKETDTCMVVMENDVSEPHEKLGPPPEDWPTVPVMHFDCRRRQYVVKEKW